MKHFLPLVLILFAGCKCPNPMCGVEDNKRAYIADPHNECVVRREYPDNKQWDSMWGVVRNTPFTAWYCRGDLILVTDYDNGKPWRP